MPHLRALRRLTSAQRVLLLQASGLLLIIAIRLRLQSFASLMSSIDRRRCAYAGSPTLAAERVEEIARWVDVADRHGLLRPSCLRKSLVLAWMLSGHGVVSTVRIGVAKEQLQLRAHAWLAVGGVHPQQFFRETEFSDLLSPAPASTA